MRGTGTLRTLLLTVLIPTLWAVTGCSVTESQSDTKKALPPAVRVSVEEVQPETIRDVLVLPGETEARHDVRLAAERDGRVEWVGHEEGQRVSKGELLMRIDVDALKAAIDRIKATVRMKEDVAKRRRNLQKGGMISQEALDTALTELTQAQCNLLEAQEHYEQGFVRSPINGVVNKRYVDPGEFVQRGNPVADLVDNNTIRIYVNVPEMDIRYLKVGQKVHVKIDAYPESSWTGQIDFVALKADRATKTFSVRVVVENSDGRIRPGMIAHVAFLRRLIPHALAAPLFAIVDKGGERIVFVEQDGQAQARTITVGVIHGDKAEIVKGLRAGEKLIVTGQHDVEEGTRVSVQ